MTKKVVLYHGSCPDGFTSAWVAWRALGDSAEYIPCAYGGKVPDVTDKEVYIVDFSFKRDVMLDLATKAKRIVVLDHHKSAKEDLEYLSTPNLEVHFDMNRSGAGMTRDYFFPGQKNWLVDYVQDRDLWKFELPDSRVVNAYLCALPHEFEVFERVFEEGLSSAGTLGEGCLTWIRYYVENVKETAKEMTFLGYENIPVVNAPYPSISEIVGELSEGHEFAVGWHCKKPGKVNYSLRSRHGFDVADLAKKFGGGGHKAAAGFHSDKLPWELVLPVPESEGKNWVHRLGLRLKRLFGM